MPTRRVFVRQRPAVPVATTVSLEALTECVQRCRFSCPVRQNNSNSTQSIDTFG